MGQSDPVVGQILHFGPFPFEKINKWGAKKWKTNRHHIYSKTQESHPNHWGGPIDPKLRGPSSCNMVCIKKVTFQDVCSVDLLWYLTVLRNLGRIT